jgi:hypothetical protein
MDKMNNMARKDVSLSMNAAFPAAGLLLLVVLLIL